MNSPPSEMAALCPHLDVCNGCPTMRVSYSEQVNAKQKMVQNALQYYVEAFQMVPAESLSFYRNRADFWYDPTQKLGFRSKNDRFEGVEVPHCQLVSARAQKLYSFLSDRVKTIGFESYSILEQKGYLRYVVLRESKSTGKLLIALITFSREHSIEMETLANEMIEQKLTDGMVWMHHPGFNDSFDGEIVQEWGEPLLTETLNGIPFVYNMKCFFQTNPRMAEKLQKYVIDLVPEKNSVLDLYCGVGLFSIPLALKGHLVKGIEMGKESILFARKNAHALGLSDDSFSFEVGDVPKKLQEFEKTNEKFDTIILDPPRSGLSKKIWRRLLRLQPNQFIYVSCNLDALKRDLEWLEEYAEFKIENPCAFDLFPHTTHVETVVNIIIEKVKEYPKGGF